MKRTTVRIGFMALGLLSSIPFTIHGASSDPESAHGHLSGLTAKITMCDGVMRTVTLQGVGCTQSICSRAAIKAKTEADSVVRTWFDSLAAIKDTTGNHALFVSRDGTSRRMSLITDFRVLYLANRLGRTEKLDLANIRSVEFITSAR